MRIADSIERDAPATVPATGNGAFGGRVSSAVNELRRSASADHRRTRLLDGAELALLALWTLLITGYLLDWDPFVVPNGRDLVVNTIGHNTWTHLGRCGLCALWNGDIQGGVPALVDPLAATLHPTVIVSTLLWGVVNGAKATLIASFFLTGLGQWALAGVLGVGRLARLWSAAMAVAAGHLFGATSGGLVPIVTSVAAASLLLPALIKLARSPTRRLAIATGALLAGLIVSGQGYAQIGFVLATPLVAVLVVGRGEHARRFVRELGVAAAIGCLLAAPFLVPLLHFYPHFGKQLAEPTRSAQPFRFAVLNLVIDDDAFYRSESLQKLSFPEWYMNYVGWPAVVLAVVGAALLWRQGSRRLAAYLAAFPIVVIWLSAAAPFQWLFDRRDFSAPLADFAGGIRTPSLIAKLAIAPILGLAAVGFDALARLPRLDVRARLATEGEGMRQVRFGLDPRLVMALVGIAVLLQVRSVGQRWLWTERYPEAEIQTLVGALHTTNLQWVQPPVGEAIWAPAALDEGRRLAFFHRPWDWKDGTDPEPALTGSRGEESGMIALTKIGDLTLYRAPPGRDYAGILHADGGWTPCEAHGEGGDIDVSCDAPQPGVLVVRERSYSGWKARVNDQGRAVDTSDLWLRVDVPVELRYRPWDAMVGFALMAVGLVLGGYWLVRPHPRGSAGAFDTPSAPAVIFGANGGGPSEDVGAIAPKTR